MSVYSPLDALDIHLSVAMLYFFAALFTMLLITLSEYRSHQDHLIIPASSSLNLIADVFFLVALIITLTNTLLPKTVSTLAEWSIFLTQMIWLYVHSMKFKPKLNP